MPNHVNMHWKYLVRHRRGRDDLYRMLASMRYGHPSCSWDLVAARYGDAALEMGVHVARHKGYKLLYSMESKGYIRRLPTKMPTTAPTKDYRRRVVKDDAWTITEAGVEYMREYMEYQERLSTDRAYRYKVRWDRRANLARYRMKKAASNNKEVQNANQEDHQDNHQDNHQDDKDRQAGQG